MPHDHFGNEGNHWRFSKYGTHLYMLWAKNCIIKEKCFKCKKDTSDKSTAGFHLESCRSNQLLSIVHSLHTYAPLYQPHSSYMRQLLRRKLWSELNIIIQLIHILQKLRASYDLAALLAPRQVTLSPYICTDMYSIQVPDDGRL